MKWIAEQWRNVVWDRIRYR